MPHEYDIVVNENLSDTEKCATIFHELGHYYAGHLWHSADNKGIPNRGSLPISVREFEAETICYLLCERSGIKNPSVEYLNGYLDSNQKIPQGISIDAILKACGKIERMRDGLNPLRELKK